MGSLTEYGWLPAFSVELNDNDNIECLYVSLLFDEKLDDEIMEIIENQIREALPFDGTPLKFIFRERK